MKNSSRYFENKECEYFPCHDRTGDFNCLFCYCPLYQKENCPGSSRYLEKNGRRIKDCSGCTFPHQPENYEAVIEGLKG
ncbi:MAG: cysteine-rich small domain-containing protein [Bacillus sp. (in: Bacteria)]|nr:cysteine-rich small domain-containing protein [Bacillus sp. (in: firmicutes)]MCM1427446.1 cysteine-rich small domain-containing protein [Eubacterium sp.]